MPLAEFPLISMINLPFKHASFLIYQRTYIVTQYNIDTCENIDCISVSPNLQNESPWKGLKCVALDLQLPKVLIQSPVSQSVCLSLLSLPPSLALPSVFLFPLCLLV